MTAALVLSICIVGFAGLVVVQVRMSKRMARQHRRVLARLADMPMARKYHDLNEYRQLSAFYQLHAFLAPVAPLPAMRDWAISPDVALLLIRLVGERKPVRIVELGGGVSTLICAYCLRSAGAGKVLSIDHDPRFAGKTRAELDRHGLGDWAEVRVAELRRSEYLDDAGQGIDWYDADVVNELPRGIDMLLVDGPPAAERALARYPALPMLYDRLSPAALLLLDDADRPQEQAVLERWQREFPNARYIHEPVEKGAAIVTL